MSKEVMEELSQRRPVGISRRRYCELTGQNRTSHYYTSARGRKRRICALCARWTSTTSPTRRPVSSRCPTCCGCKDLPSTRRASGGGSAKWGRRPYIRSKPGQAAYERPYLPCGLKTGRRNQMWSADISYIPMERSFMYLYVIIDVYSRYIVGGAEQHSRRLELRGAAPGVRPQVWPPGNCQHGSGPPVLIAGVGRHSRIARYNRKHRRVRTLQGQHLD